MTNIVEENVFAKLSSGKVTLHKLFLLLDIPYENHETYSRLCQAICTHPDATIEHIEILCSHSNLTVAQIGCELLAKNKDVTIIQLLWFFNLTHHHNLPGINQYVETIVNHKEVDLDKLILVYRKYMKFVIVSSAPTNFDQNQTLLLLTQKIFSLSGISSTQLQAMITPV
jgi:hypothetical protein